MMFTRNQIVLGLVAILSCVERSSADFIRFGLQEIRSIEPREWDTDNIWANLNLVTPQSQNITTHHRLGNITRGKTFTTDQCWKDITLSGNEPWLYLTFWVYNAGDTDAQDIGLKIASQVLSISSRIPVANVVTTILDNVLQLFQGSYQCQGPIAIKAFQLQQQQIKAMPYNQPICLQDPFRYGTQKGCVNVDPTTTKTASYVVKYCYAKVQGNSTAVGSTYFVSTAGKQYEKISNIGLVILVGIVVLLSGWN